MKKLLPKVYTKEQMKEVRRVKRLIRRKIYPSFVFVKDEKTGRLERDPKTKHLTWRRISTLKVLTED